MSSGFDDIGAAIPLRGFLQIGLVTARREIKQIPERHRQADVERERQLVRNHLVADWRNGHEIGADGQHIVVAHFGVGGIRHGWIEALAIVTSALVQSGKEFIVGPASDAGLAIGRDVWRNQHAKRRLQRQATSKRLSARCSMTCAAIAEHRKVASALDSLETLGLLRGCGPGQGNNETRDCERTAHQSLLTSADRGFSNSDP